MNSIICVDISVLISSLNASFSATFQDAPQNVCKITKKFRHHQENGQINLQNKAKAAQCRGLLPQSRHCALRPRPCAVITVSTARGCWCCLYCVPARGCWCCPYCVPARGCWCCPYCVPARGCWCRPYCASSPRLEVTSCRGRPDGWRRSCICGCVRSSRWRRVPGPGPRRPRYAARR